MFVRSFVMSCRVLQALIICSCIGCSVAYDSDTAKAISVSAEAEKQEDKGAQDSRVNNEFIFHYLFMEKGLFCSYIFCLFLFGNHLGDEPGGNFDRD